MTKTKLVLILFLTLNIQCFSQEVNSQAFEFNTLYYDAVDKLGCFSKKGKRLLDILNT